MEDGLIFDLQEGDGPLAAAAIHHGHAVRDEVADLLALPEADRLREEDPFTGGWTEVAPTRVIGLRSRFEVDLNRPRERAIYLTPDDAWGLQVWRTPPPIPLQIQSLLEYDAFYAEMRRLFTAMAAQHGRFVVLDLHSYNHRREGPDGPAADPALNPEINIGTRTMQRDRWSPLIDRFIAELRAFNFLGRRLDVRENVKFGGGYFPLWTHGTFPESACVLSIEVKKFFMDEWSGQPEPAHLAAIKQALAATIPGVLEALNQL